MKLKDFQSLINGKDLTQEAVQTEVFQALNSDFNNTVTAKDAAYAQLKQNNDEAVKKANELATQNAYLNNSNYIIRKAPQATEQDIDDIISMAQRRVSESVNAQQAMDMSIDRLFGQYRQMAPVGKEVPIQTPSVPQAAVNPTQKVFDVGTPKVTSVPSPSAVINNPVPQQAKEQQNPVFSIFGVGDRTKSLNGKSMFRKTKSTNIV